MTMWTSALKKLMGRLRLSDLSVEDQITVVQIKFFTMLTMCGTEVDITRLEDLIAELSKIRTNLQSQEILMNSMLEIHTMIEGIGKQ